MIPVPKKSRIGEAGKSTIASTNKVWTTEKGFESRAKYGAIQASKNNTNILKKTAICFRWRRGKCRLGDGCRFRHFRDDVSDSGGFVLNISPKGKNNEKINMPEGYGRCTEETMFRFS